MSQAKPKDTSEHYLHPDARIPSSLAFGLGFQAAGIMLPTMVLNPMITFRAGGASQELVLWVAFVSVAICGAAILLQAVRLGRLGAGYVFALTIGGLSIPISVDALLRGGPPLLATLVAATAAVQFLLSQRLFILRRILTPTVTGSVMMLTPVAVLPIISNQLGEVPDSATSVAAPVCALITLVVTGGLVVKGSRSLRLWSPVLGIMLGTLAAWWLGIYDFSKVLSEAWIGFPQPLLPGFDLSFGASFWSLLPGFLLIGMICSIRTISGSVATQDVSWPEARAVDFRSVQGAMAGESVGNVMASIAGTTMMTYRSTGASLVEVTGISSRRIGIAIGCALMVLALSPKALALILATPGPVVAAFVTVLLATIFVTGVKIVAHDGIDHRKGMVVGLSFWLGAGVQYDLIFPTLVEQVAGGLLGNGMIAGGLIAILLTFILEITKPRRTRVEAELNLTTLARIREALTHFSKRSGWDLTMSERLEAVCEETLLTLLNSQENPEESGRRLLMTAHKEDGYAVLEFVASTEGENLQDQIALLGEQVDAHAIERDVSLRILRHLASSVHHQQYHDTDIVTLRVEPPEA